MGVLRDFSVISMLVLDLLLFPRRHVPRFVDL